MLRRLATAGIGLALLTISSAAVLAASQQPPPVDAMHLRGTVELRADTPAERSVSKGSFDILWAEGGKGGSKHVKIENGRWEVEFRAPVGCELWIRNIEANEAPALLFTNKPPVISESRSFAWSFERMPQVSLEVVDAGTGAPLGDVELRGKQILGLVSTNDQVPRREETQALGAKLTNPVRLSFDPISIHPNAVGRCYFMRAQGYAWTSFVVDHRVAGSRLVCLEPAGTVELRPRAAGKALAASDKLWISIWRESGGARLRLTSMKLSGGADPAPIDGLPTGEILIGTSTKGAMLRIDAADRITRANVLAGKTTTVELDCTQEPAAQPILVSVRCAFDFPAELIAAEEVTQLMFVSTKPLRQYAPAPGSLDSLRAGAGRARLAPRFDAVPPGEYFLSGNFPPVAIRVQVGTSDARVSQRIEECGTVRLRASEASAPKFEQLDWCMYGPDGDQSLPMPATFDKQANEWIVRAPVGRVQLQATDSSSERLGQQDLVVATGDTRGDLKLVWECRTAIRLLDGGVSVLRPPAWWESARVTTAEGAAVKEGFGWRTKVNEMRGNGELLRAHPGDVIQLPVPPGYERPAPIRVPDAGFADGVDVKIELVRKKW